MVATGETIGEDVRALLTIIRHREMIADRLEDLAHELRQSGRQHDRSKLARAVFPGFVDIDAGWRPDSNLAKEAVAAHYAAEDHHPAHHARVDDMGWLAIIEMVIDWWAASRAYAHNPGSYGFKEGIHRELKRFGFSDGQTWLIWQVAGWLEGVDIAKED